MATTVLGLKTFTASDPVDYNEINDNYNKIDNGVKTALKGRAAHNWLDNSDFTHPVNQRGTSSTKKDGDYIADRWIVNISNSAATVSIGSGGITLKPTSSNYVGIYQKFEHYAEMSGKVYTLGVCINGMWESTTFTMANEASGKPLPSGLRVYSTGNTFQVMIRNIAGATPVTIQRVALYEGSYTADTLPAYQPKGYAAELAECQRYYREVYRVFGEPVGNVAREAIMLNPPMRISPTATVKSLWKGTDDTSVTVNLTANDNVDVTYTGYGNLRLSLSADL